MNFVSFINCGLLSGAKNIQQKSDRLPSPYVIQVPLFVLRIIMILMLYNC